MVRLGKIGDMTVADSTTNGPIIPNASDVYAAHLLPLHSFVLIKQTNPTLVIKLMDFK